MQSKLSRHQETILQILAEEIKDEFWGVPVTMLSRIAAHRLETEPGNYIFNRQEWRKRRRSEEVNRFKKGEIDAKTLNLELFFLGNNPRKLSETLTEKWRATFSRCLKRLEDRGLITRIGEIRYETLKDGKKYFVRYLGGRTRRVVLTPEGREIGERKVN